MDLTTEGGVLEYMRTNGYPSCAKVERLSDGFVGFVFRAYFPQPARPGSLIIKHAEDYAARTKGIRLDQTRLLYEFQALRYLSAPGLQSDNCVRVPKVVSYDHQAYVLIMEDVGRLPSVKQWFTPNVDLKIAMKIGRALGSFLARVHNASSGSRELLNQFHGNTAAKDFSGSFFFDTMPATAKKFGYEDAFIRQAAREGQQEVQNSEEVLTIGDFWTANVLVRALNLEDLQLFVLDLELSKPGTAAYDIGQMAAEMYCLAAFRDGKLGMGLLTSFFDAYKQQRHGKIDVAKVAIRMAAQLFVVVPWVWTKEGSEEKVKEVIKLGRELIRLGWERDEAGLRRSIVRTLM